MKSLDLARRRGLAALTVLAVFVLVSPALRADDDKKTDLKAKALALNDITGEDPIRGQIQALLEDQDGAKKLVATAVPMAKQKDQPFGYNAALILGRVAFQLREVEASQTFFRVCAEQAAKLHSSQKLGQAYLGLLSVVDLMYATRKYEETAKLCQEFLELLDKHGVASRLKDEVLRRMIRALTKQGKPDEAAQMVDNLLKARSSDWRNLELKAWLKRETGHADEAVKIYEDLIEKIRKDKSLEKEEKEDLLPEIHYILSGVYVDLDQIDKAAEHLKTLLSAHPDDPTYNNDLGYIWADHDMNLDEAEKMIRKALDEDRKQRLKANPDLKAEDVKDNAAYLDSLGWVLFKRKKFEEAKPLLQKAVQDKEGQHIEIFDHLGDVHMALGEKDEAVKAWKKGIEAAGTSPREKERKAQVEKKLKEQK
jgi:tetratricopeptide (TPR) repeat protein